MTSLVNKSADWPPNYHKILKFFLTTSLKSLRTARIDELADSNEAAKIEQSQKDRLDRLATDVLPHSFTMSFISSDKVFYKMK